MAASADIVGRHGFIHVCHRGHCRRLAGRTCSSSSSVVGCLVVVKYQMGRFQAHAPSQVARETGAEEAITTEETHTNAEAVALAPGVKPDRGRDTSRRSPRPDSGKDIQATRSTPTRENRPWASLSFDEAGALVQSEEEIDGWRTEIIWNQPLSRLGVRGQREPTAEATGSQRLAERLLPGRLSGLAEPLQRQ